MSKRPAVLRGVRKHVLTDSMKNLAAVVLAQKIGYLRIGDFPDTRFFETLPTQLFSPHRIIRCKNEAFFVKNGLIEIWHTHHDYLVKELRSGVLFGDMPLLGQTMIGTRAISGTEGATLGVLNPDAARQWIKANSIVVVEALGPRLASIDAEHYRSCFQLADSRIAALLLELAGESSTVEGFTHGEIGEKIGLYRETVTSILDAMKLDRLIKIERKKIIILDNRALRELTEL